MNSKRRYSPGPSMSSEAEPLAIQILVDGSFSAARTEVYRTLVTEDVEVLRFDPVYPQHTLRVSDKGPEVTVLKSVELINEWCPPEGYVDPISRELEAELRFLARCDAIVFVADLSSPTAIRHTRSRIELLERQLRIVERIEPIAVFVVAGGYAPDPILVHLRDFSLVDSHILDRDHLSIESILGVLIAETEQEASM